MAITINGSANTIGGIASGGLNADAVGIDDLNATGTASSSTFLRGDNSWAAAGGIAETHQGVCKAWVNFDGTVSSGYIQQDFNIDSITDHGTGDWTITFDSDFADTNYCFVGLAQNGEGTSNHDSHVVQSAYYDGQAVGSFRVCTLRTRYDAVPPQYIDSKAVCVAFFR